ncbi:MAG: hypothetical protein CMP67_02330 [Flavobacteriales bacterium]|nr:hypothetical protein [Flavobacteriales bacterium]|tara:strand:- start:9873 stop:10223 length:351 start_codon:yes stop_codon:yes gene_type:complete
MFDLNTRIIDLTVADLKEIIKDSIREVQNEKPNIYQIQETKSDVMYIDEVAELTKLSKNSVYSKVSKMEMPYVSRGRPLTFSRKQIEDWIMNGRPNFLEQKVDEQLANLNRRKKRC